MKLHLPCSLLTVLLAAFALAESVTHAVEVPENYTSDVIYFTRPYIWLIADLATDTAIESFGFIEGM